MCAGLSAKRYLVAANWKMNGSKAQASSLVKALIEGGIGDLGVDVVVCPPSPYLAQLALALPPVVALGGQNLHVEDQGAFTGEISGAMLKDVGCRYVIVGHSERRTSCGETDDEVAAKVRAAQRNGLVPVLCVGESAEERGADRWREIIRRQLDSVVQSCGAASFADMVVAYEPVWAIGTGNTATPEQAQEVHAMIRDHLAAAGITDPAALRVLYGGSVNAANAQALFAMRDIDGALVGGASLVAEEFAAICRTAERSVSNVTR